MVEWKKIPGRENHSVSNEGNIRNDVTGRILKNSTNNKGYVRVCMSNGANKNGTIIHNHRLVAQLFVPNPLNKNIVNHIDGNKSNPHYKNLEWVTDKENTEHAIRTGLFNPVEHTKKATKNSLPTLSLKTKTIDNEGNVKIYDSVKDLSKILGFSTTHLNRKINRKSLINGLRVELIRPPLKQEEGLIPVKLFIPEKIKSFIKNTKEAYGKKKFYFVLNDNNLNDVIFKPNESLINRWYFCKHGNYKLVYSTDDLGRAYIDIVPININEVQDVKMKVISGQKYLKFKNTNKG